MSSDPTQPVPEWWQQGPKRDQPDQRDQDYRGNQDYQDSQATQQYPTGQAPSGSAFPGGQGYQGIQGYQGTQGYQGSQGYPPAAQGYQAPPRMRRRRRRWPLITLIVIIVVLVVGDRAAKAYTEDQMASQVQSSLALSGKPHVTIQGFPFLTQLAARTFNTVDMNATNETAGPSGQLEIASLTATLHGMHIHGLKSATVDQFNASALITFTALAQAGGVPESIKLSADGPDTIKFNIDVLGLRTSATAKVTQVGDSKINIKVTNLAGLPGDVLGSAADFTVGIPKLPAGVTIKSVSVTQQGLRITATGRNTTLSQ